MFASAEEAPATDGLVAKKIQSSEDNAPQPGVVIKEWDPKTPYIEALKAVAEPNAEKLLAEYMKQRATYANSPAFFLDCGDFFQKRNMPEIALRIYTNLAEMRLEDASVLRVLARRLQQIGENNLAIELFERILTLRPGEPQSHRDLALAIAQKAGELVAKGTGTPGKKMISFPGGWMEVPNNAAGESPADVAKMYSRAMELLAKVVMGKWDRFEEIEVIALMELNAMIPAARAAGVKDIPLDERLIKLLDLDLRIVLNWDADMTDIDLHVTEPTGEKAFYSHNRTLIGGLVSRDFTQGYGPEEYCLKKAIPGMYKIEVNYYGSSAAKVQGATTVQAEVITNFGRANEKRKTLTLRLTEQKETILVGEVEF